MRRVVARVSFVIITLLLAAGAIVGPVQDANAATSLYGRAEYQEYFSGGYATGAAYSCGNGQLICGGISVGDTNSLVQFYWDHLYSSDEQNRVAAAFTILAMLGVDGPSAGGNITNGINNARARFGEWDARVRSYGDAGRINFNQNFSFSTNTAYRSQDVLWHNDADTAAAIVFTLPNGSNVAIKRSCANLVGAAYLEPLPPRDYSLSASTGINRTQAAPGDRITWAHQLSNNGPAATSQNTYSNLGMSGFSNGWASGLSGAFIGPGAGVGVIRAGWAYNVYDITSDDVGNTLCQWVQFDPINSAGARDGRGNQACVSVPYNYTLNPEITNITNGDMVESAAGTVPVIGRVSNSGGTKSAPNTQWQVSQIRYAPGVVISNSTGGISAGAPCVYFAGNSACGPLQAGTEATGYDRNATVTYPVDGIIGDEPVGTRFCYVMSIKPNASTSADWRHSRLYCLVVGKHPKLQVYGGDLIVGRGTGTGILANVRTSVSKKGPTYFGSWAEYGILASGTVRGMASGSGYAAGATSSDLCNLGSPLSLLTFANATGSGSPATCNSSNIGRYAPTSPSQFDALKTRFAVTAGAPNLTGNINVAGLTSKSVYPGSGIINLSSSTDIPAGKWVIINAPDATVRITSDIRYTNAVLTSAADIPQLVIIARNIIITDNVTNVDAWLLAKGTGANGVVNTCDSGVTEPSGLTSNVCASKLTINGPVIANHLLLYRTAGSGVGADSGDAAEVFNLRPDAYMWASTFSGTGTKARTATTTELPPRF